MGDGPEDPALQRPRLVKTEALHLCIRPVTPEDREALRQGFQAISPETTYRRFFVSAFSPSDQELEYLTEVDGRNHVAIGAEDCTQTPPKGMGVARYVRLPDEPTVAEAAVVVIDAYQRQGIGSLLLAALSKRAADCGLKTFRGYVLRNNSGVLDVLRALGASEASSKDGVLELDIPVVGRLEALPDRPELKRLRWAWSTLAAAEVGECAGGTEK